MTDKKPTDEQIKKALELCATLDANNCKKCPCQKICNECDGTLTKMVLDLINRQKAEVERYKKTVGKLATKDGKVVGILKGKETEFIEKEVAETFKTMAVNRAKSEAIKEVTAELYNSLRQYENYDTHHTYEILDRIESVEEFLLNNLVKEMVGDNK